MKRNKFVVSMLTMATAGMMLLSGCGKDESKNKEDKEQVAYGVITLSVNPEIAIEYDKDGNVLSVEGRNSDGKEIVASFTDYTGKQCDVVIEGLIEEIHEAGYFVDDIDGNSKSIVIQLESGSDLPDDDFMDNISVSAKDTVTKLNMTSPVVDIDKDDYDETYAKDGKESPYITLDKAKEIALAQANVSAADAVFEDKEFDHDDGVAVFELEFTANGISYEYDIDALTGRVIKAESDKDDLDDIYDDNDDMYDDDLDDVYDDMYDDDYDDIYDDDYDDVYDDMYDDRDDLDDDYDDIYDDVYDDDYDDYDDDWDDDYDDDYDDDDWDDYDDDDDD